MSGETEFGGAERFYFGIGDADVVLGTLVLAREKFAEPGADGGFEFTGEIELRGDGACLELESF